MRRFASFNFAPSETRRLLRDRFSRHLPSRQYMASKPPAVVALRDESVLCLFQRLHVDCANSLDTARTTYEMDYSAAAGEPRWEDLITAGWIRPVWGRFFTSFEVSRAISASQMPALAALVKGRHIQSYRVDRDDGDATALDPAIAAIARDGFEPRAVHCQSPEWVAARLWDRGRAGKTEPAKILRVWVDRWEQLGSPSLAPAQVWNETDAKAFHDAAIGTITTEPGIIGWDTVRTRIVKELALAGQQTPADLEGYVPPVPATLVDRALWLESPITQRLQHESFQACDELFGLVRLLLADVEAQEHSRAPHETAEELLTLALERPEVLLFLLLRVQLAPALLADLLLFPPTSALACLLVAQWRSPGNAWERELIARDDMAAKATAFADAIAIMGEFLQQGSVLPQEVAALWQWLHSNAQPGFVDDVTDRDFMLTALRGELLGLHEDKMVAMLNALTAASPGFALGSPAFATAIDVVETGQLEGVVDPVPLVEAYIRSIVTGHYTLSAHRLGVDSAASLFALAKRAPAETYQRFLQPLDLATLLATAKQGDGNPFTIASDIALSLRTHMRILSRAIAASKGGVPNELTDALIGTVRDGVSTQVSTATQTQSVPVAAFSPRHDNMALAKLDRPVAADLAAALAALTDNSAKRLLDEILKTDEPMLLAQLLSYSPQAMRADIADRLDTLTPAAAGDVYSLTEVQARIEELLSAGAASAATRFMDVERDMRTLGKVPGRELTRLHNTLRLQFLRGDWPGIEQTQAPDGLTPHERSSFVDTITFFRALSALKKPGGSPELAEQLLMQLHNRRPDVVAYAQNLFAARVSIVLQGDLFGELRGEKLRRARELLRDAPHIMGRSQTASRFDAEVFSCNKALLLLASGEPDQAIELLVPFSKGSLQDTVAAYSAVALSRKGRIPEALSAIRSAELTLGNTEVLKAARAHVEDGDAYPVIASVLSQDDLKARVKQALQDFLAMPHNQQAGLFRADPGAFDDLVIDYVRTAAASILSLVSVMRGIVIDEFEDDINAVIGELLTARCAFLGWSWGDQSKGGFTAKGNPGERDLKLHRSGAELSVIEAVMCKNPITQEATRGELKSHFQKLFAYTSCPLLFHVTYSYVVDPNSVIDYLGTVAEQDPPPGFRYLDSTPLAHVDSSPSGFVARYRGDQGFIKVVFLLLDMGKHRQRDAATLAAASNPRAPKVQKQSKAKRPEVTKRPDL